MKITREKKKYAFTNTEIEEQIIGQLTAFTCIFFLRVLVYTFLKTHIQWDRIIAAAGWRIN